MNQMTLVINENISIVSILALQNIRHNRVPRLASYKIVSGNLEPILILVSEFFDKVAV
jgi:hypothetical protein